MVRIIPLIYQKLKLRKMSVPEKGNMDSGSKRKVAILKH
ncbi:hypothetical protein ADICYQ_3724 [Cyclobacterium qasimii M12-11B]|uniref:Uncharacterized protein n=1 Tax=Cyclobacterium qasimii M12-11B TaxID=641524 RepID=S7WKD3_9BACT|nr:hypothetical protein ADICYQ_3724 [Cyclobacterium qasimii M12-11B]